MQDANAKHIDMMLERHRSEARQYTPTCSDTHPEQEALGSALMVAAGGVGAFLASVTLTVWAFSVVEAW